MVAKHRNGPTGNLMLHFNGSLARFEDLQSFRYEVEN
jgi:replicative DNA helicase